MNTAGALVKQMRNLKTSNGCNSVLKAVFEYASTPNLYSCDKNPTLKVNLSICSDTLSIHQEKCQIDKEAASELQVLGTSSVQVQLCNKATSLPTHPNVEFSTIYSNFPRMSKSGEVDLVFYRTVAYTEHSFHFLNPLSQFDNSFCAFEICRVGSFMKSSKCTSQVATLISPSTVPELWLSTAIRACITSLPKRQ
ncbi:hypothetical protein Tco_0540536 [Tanacetum coccineum]